MGIENRLEPNAAKVMQILREGDAVLLTSGTALAADWKRRLVEAAGDGVCATPRVYGWSQWLAELASRADDLPVPLGELQEQLLWERVIRADRDTADAASIRGLARHASRAYALMREYRIDARELAGEGEEAEAFYRWVAGMQRELATMERLLAADLPEMLQPELGRWVGERYILLDGFTEHTPMQQALLQALREVGMRLESVSGAEASAKLTLTSCNGADAEYRHVAQRIATHLASDPQSRIGVLLSRQVQDAGRLRRILNEFLLPHELATVATREDLQAAQMIGEPLSAAPLVNQLLRLLQLAGKTGAEFAAFSPLLFSPGLKGYAAEREARARFDAMLRENNRHYVGFKSLLGMREIQCMPQLSSVLKALLVWDATSRPAGEWVRAVHALLQGAGYLEAEAEGRSSSDIRQLNAFRECLASLAAVDAVQLRMSWSVFLSLLASRCHATLLGIPAYLPGVCVLPLEQAPGMRFDAVFAIGFDEEALPLPARPAPLLPFSVQRRHGLPGATAAQAFEESEILWRQVLASAPVVHASFARSREEHELGPSPLLVGIAAEVDDATINVSTQAGMQEYDDAPAVPLRAEEQVSGGSFLVRSQSACPFRAFATHRLDIVPLGETTPGIEAKDKGSLLHAALEYIWTHIRSQSELAALDEERLAALVEAAVEHAWHVTRLSVPGTTRDFEHQRMRRALGEWLEVERKRPPFSVERCEKVYRLHLPEDGKVRFELRLKADRIDRDDGGRKILIDYKSGRKQSPGEWIGERMREPQLPLYAIAEGLGGQDAVCFARVRSGDMGFEGLSGVDTGIKGIELCDGKRNRPEDWPELLAEWREEIDALAGEFVAGRAEVVPRNPAACAWCGLEAVCRIGEIGFADEGIDDAGERV